MTHATRWMAGCAVLLAPWLVGCASQGRATYDTFQSSNDYLVLHASLEEAREAGREGSAAEQFAVVRELRYLSRYDEEPGKRELAVRGLAELAYFSDDDDVRARARSRLDAILTDDAYDLHLKLVVVESLRDIVIGRTGHIEASLFSDEKTFVRASTSDRADALEFLVDRFPDMPPLARYRAVAAFERIINNPSESNEDIQEDQAEWVGDLLSEVVDWLGDDEMSDGIKRALIEMAATRKGLLAKWKAEESFSPGVDAMVNAVLERQERYEAGPRPRPVPESFRDVATLLERPPDVLATHLDAALLQGALAPKGGAGEHVVVPAPLAFHPFPDTPIGFEQRTIVVASLVRSLRLGMILDDKRLVEQLMRMIEDSEDLPRLEQALEFTVAAMPSLVAQGADASRLFDLLEEGVRGAEDPAESRLYLRALVNSTPYFRGDVGARLEKLKPDLDVVAGQLVLEWRANLPKAVKPITPGQLPEAIKKEKPPPLDPPPGPAPDPSKFRS